MVKQRVKALKNLHAQFAQVESRFYEDLYGLDQKYAVFYQPLFDKRADIINEIREPTEGECQWQVSVPEELGRRWKESLKGRGKPRASFAFGCEHLKILCSMTQGNDELAPEHPKDVKLKFSGVRKPMSFTLRIPL